MPLRVIAALTCRYCLGMLMPLHVLWPLPGLLCLRMLLVTYVNGVHQPGASCLAAAMASTFQEMDKCQRGPHHSSSSTKKWYLCHCHVCL